MPLLSIGEFSGGPIVPSDECKSHLRIDGADFDAELTRLLMAAQRAASREAGVLFGTAACTAIFDGFPPRYDGWQHPGTWASNFGPFCGSFGPGGSLVLGTRPVTAVQSVTYFDGAAWQAADPATYRFTLETGRLIPLGGWPTAAGPESVRVSFTAGSTVLPIEARQAILLILGHYFENRGDEFTKEDLPKAALRLLWQLHDARVVG